MVAKKKSAKKKPMDHEGKAYQAALKEFGAALKLLREGAFEKAREAFGTLAEEHSHEPELAQRARTYIRVCEEKLAAEPGEPCTPDGWYYLGVVRSNQGRREEALECFGKALQQDPTSPKYLYARAATYGLMERAEAAVNDLRQAVLGDPTVRFQAVNDSDFEPIRDDAGFIDLVEPTPVEG